MNKRLIASLLAVCVATGSGLQVPVKLLGSTIDTYGHMSLAQERQILESNGILSSQFTAANQPQYKEYEEIFKVKGIAQYKNNGKQYSQSVLERAFDGDIKTHWETGIENSAQFKNEVVVTFDEATEINRIVYAPRPGNKGHVKQMSIYASLTEDGEDFELVASGQTDIRSSLSEFKFKNTEFKRLKFVFDEAHQNWAAAGEFMFFKEDQVAEKIGGLFTDATMSQVSEEFNTVEKIKALEVEAKSHPFYESYKEDLLNAIELVEQEEIITTDAKISKFETFYTSYIDSYDESFRVGSERIESITNNGGQYPGTALKYAIDEDVNTHWETGKPNSDVFKNEITITLDQAEVLNRIVYKSRQGGKGFAKNFSVYASPTTKGDNFSKITTGEYAVTNDLLEIQFSPTKAKRLKFVFDHAQENWASIGDFRLYKEDKVQDKMKTLFTNGLMNEVSEAFNTIEQLNVLEGEMKGHPLEELFKRDLQIAKDIVQGKIETTKVVVAEQHGDMASHASKNLKFGFGNNNQPTGVLAKPGDVITVYVDADPTQPLPKLFFSQQEGSYSSWGKVVNLHPGKNVITTPEIPKNSAYGHEVTKGGPIYIVNPYTKEQQSKAPVIRFVGGERFPFLTADTDVEEFKQCLIDYKKRVDEDIKANPDVLDRKVIDTFEFVSDHIVWTGTATGAYKTYIEDGINPLETIESYNTHMKEIFKYYGLDGSSINNDPKKIRENVRLAQPFGYMYAYSNHIGVQGDVMANHLIPFEKRGTSWGLTHEIGHRMDIGVRTIGEVTNNMLPMYMSGYYNKMDTRIPYESRTYKNVMSENSNSFWEGDYFEKLAPFWQLELYKPGYWGEVNELYRERNVKLGSEDANSDKLQYIIRFSSEVIGEDLTGYFARHGFNVTDETRKETSKYPKPTKKIWYLNNAKFKYEGNGFSEPTHVEVNLTKDTKGNKLSFEINDEAKSDLLGYEIIKDGEVIGFTATNSFIDTNVDDNKNSKYEIIPYDLNLKTGESSVVNTFSPKVELSRYQLTLGLNNEFNATDYVKAVSYKGEDLSSNIKVESNVDTSKQGKYEIKYTIEDQGLVTESILPVEVVSSFAHTSDLEWVSATTDWKTVNKDMANSSTNKIKLQVHGIAKEFDKGIGTCGNSEVIYDLEGKGMTYFSAHIGLDSNYALAKASVVFKVIADGEEIYDSGVMRVGSDAKFINLPIEGVKELKLVTTDSGDGITGDYASWGDAKFTTNSSMPILNAEDRVVKLGETVDFMEGVTATDVEDGVLTSEIKIISNTYEEGKTGRFEVIYSVADQDGHVVQKKAFITVYEDFSVKKSKYGQFDNLAEYNKQFKLPISTVSNNAGNYPGSPIERAIDSNISTHWETNSPNKATFKNEVTFDLGAQTDLDKMTYAARRGGKGFAQKFEVYVSSEAEGNDFILAGKGEYTGNGNDVIEFNLTRSNVRRVKFVFVEARQDWASIGEVAFYKADAVADKVTKALFADEDKTQVTDTYNTLDKLEALRKEVKNHPAAGLFEEDLNKAEEIIRAKFPTLEIPKDDAVKVGESLEDIYGAYTAYDAEDGDLTDEVEVSGNVDFNQPGKYTITYQVSDSDGNEVIKTRHIAVVDMNDFNYLSDYDWTSASAGWGSIRKDESPSGNIIRLTDEDGQEVQFEKGLGTHARGVVKYDLTDKDAEFFSSYVGVDRAMYGTVGSVAFEIWLDGEKVAETGVIGSRDAMEYLEVNIASAKELMIVATDGGNGIGSDHAVWGDAKLHYANENSIKVNTEALINLIEEISQLNEEDYTMQSWDILVEVKGEALALLESSFTQEQVDVMVTRLTEAKESLVKLGNNAELEALIARASDLEIHLYTAESSKILQTKLKKAKDVLNVENATQEAIDEAKEELAVAINNLELSKGKAELYRLLQIANQMEESNYTGEADWARFKEWTDYYNELYLDVTIHDEVMYELAMEGYAAMIAEVESYRIHTPEINEPEIDEVNRVELEQLITRVSELEIHLYTAESSKILQAKLKAAKDVLNIENAEQEAIDLAKEELEAAINNLELSKGKAELYRLLQIANQMEESNYIGEADWARFKEWTDYYNELYLDVTIHDEVMYELVMEGYAAMIAEIESHRIDKSEVTE